MRLIDADEVLKTICKTKLVKWQKAFIWALVDMQKTVDAVPVIRCKDCQLYYPIENHKHGHCAMYNFTHTDEDDYCSGAERKDNG